MAASKPTELAMMISIVGGAGETTLTLLVASGKKTKYIPATATTISTVPYQN
jgi:hypothetical protein